MMYSTSSPHFRVRPFSSCQEQFRRFRNQEEFHELTHCKFLCATTLRHPRVTIINYHKYALHYPNSYQMGKPRWCTKDKFEEKYSLFHAFKSRLQMQSTICCIFCLYIRHTIFLVQNVYSTENRYSTTIHSESGNKTKFSPTGNHCHIRITKISFGFEQKLFAKYYEYKIIFTLYSKF